jgi:ribonuclease HI
MELRGVLEALEYFKVPTKMKIYSDSQYVISSIVNGHVKKWFEQQDFSKKNLDLWYDILDLLEFHDVEFQWVKGHSDNEYNELCDKLAVHAAQCLNLPEDNEYRNSI